MAYYRDVGVCGFLAFPGFGAGFPSLHGDNTFDTESPEDLAASEKVLQRSYLQDPEYVTI